jgi:hypothetical protein
VIRRQAPGISPRPATIALMVSSLDGSGAQVVARLVGLSLPRPRWSPDDQSIAFTHEHPLQRVADGPSPSGDVRRSSAPRGSPGIPSPRRFGSRYSASTGSTMLYPPSNNLK